MRQQIISCIESMSDEISKISKYLYDNPETAYKEYKAMSVLSEALEKHGFKVTKNFLGLGTEFIAVYGQGEPAIAYLCEYDSLPGLGHGCGHNLIGACSMTAAIGLSKVINDIGGKVVVLGTPGEESDGSKVTMVEKNVFKDIDAALMVHPSSKTSESGVSLAMDALEFTFTGKSAHAAASPEYGINALNACIETFNMINALRQHIPSDVRIHGIISEGGIAPNIVPDRAVAKFYVRSLDRASLNEITERVKNCAKGASIGTGTQLTIRNYEFSYDNMITNHTLSRIFCHNLKESGIIDIHGPQTSTGSIDMGNVSQRVPAIHPYIQISKEDISAHTREFAEATQSEFALENMVKAACALALTGYDLITNKELLNEMKEEFSLHKNTRKP
ncbi:p-aminobenzoyl-glutamate hydrolase subunit B [Oxobacter pfennigii]|uniref:Peptidase M20 domain-containing protein 2 n=1 Tax=Oxobacter pfennigii TaxID=36849 RepID=A0A0P8W584_9CLOT|nr:M20 family metallopeptidase [Oxobacter pfennigii]KPU43057.1 p-aminobenzoyl-glutamate hydrolase subunit B [Oxobacter pfennigii]